MASIRKNPRTGQWEVRFRDATGAQRTRKVEGEGRKRDALALKAAIETDLNRGQWRDPALGKARFSEIAQEWLASNPRKKATTYARDAMVIRVHCDPLLGNMPLSRVRPSHIKAVGGVDGG